MLSLLRKHAKSWIIKIILLLIAVVFVFWGGYSYHEQGRDRIAKVDDHYITFMEYNRAYDQLVEMYRSRLGGAFSAEMIRQFNLRRQALDMLIERYLLLKAAHELSITATVQEIRSQILQYSVFQVDGKFNEQQYRLLLQQNRMTPEVFEQQLGQDISLMKVEDFIKRRAVVTDDEIDAALRFYYSPVEMGYVAFEPKTFEDEVVVEEEAVEAYFKANEAFYMEPEKRRVSYMLFKYSDFEDRLSPVEDGETGDAPEALERQDRLQDMAYRSALEFSDRAFGLQDMAKAAENLKLSLTEGGVWIAAGEPLPGLDGAPPEVLRELFSIEERDVTPVMEVPDGFLVASVEAVQPPGIPPFEAVKDRASVDLKRKEAAELARKRAASLLDAARGAGSLEKAAQEHGLEMKKSGWFSRVEPPAELTLLRGPALDALFELELDHPFPAEPLSLSGQYAAAELLARKAPDADDGERREFIAERLLAQKQVALWNAWLAQQRSRAKIEILSEI